MTRRELTDDMEGSDTSIGICAGRSVPDFLSKMTILEKGGLVRKWGEIRIDSKI